MKIAWRLNITTRIFSFLVIFLVSDVSLSANEECFNSLYLYGRDFDVSSFRKTATKEVIAEPNPGGKAGEVIKVETLKHGKDWLTTRECESCNPKRFVTDLYLVSKNDLPCNLKVGMSKSSIIGLFGKPNQETEKNFMIYYLDETENNSVGLLIKNNKLEAVYWEFYWE